MSSVPLYRHITMTAPFRFNELDHTARVMEHKYADYRVMRAHEVMVGDGVRLVPKPSKGVPFELAQPLVVSHVEHLAGLVSLTLVARRAYVGHVLGEAGLMTEQDEPETLAPWVMDADDPILVRL